MLTSRTFESLRGDGPPMTLIVFSLVIGVVLGLPLAVWLDLRTISERFLSVQAADINSLITGVRNYYATNIVERVQSASGKSPVVPNYHQVPGAIPIPATMSLELGNVVGEHQEGLSYRFVSDFPFRNRAPHNLDQFERDALTALRKDPSARISGVTGSLFDQKFRLVAPIIMQTACVDCHNSHPDSVKRDWRVGDVRGIQEVIIEQPIVGNIFGFKYLLIYFLFTMSAGLVLFIIQHRQSAAIKSAHDYLEGLSGKLSRYLSPQIYKSIFSGEKDVAISTERKKLTIFFSDIKDFTATSERLQPEELTSLLNEYLTEMSAIALKHGGTIDKYIGDAILAFFGDPESKGVAEDARACVQMAIEMQDRLAELNAIWLKRGVEFPFRARMGVNTGYCNVGNFGSTERMDYTIIGAEANLAARLQTAADPGSIVMSFETYALVRDTIRARPLPAIQVKGIARPVIPYVIEGYVDEYGHAGHIFNEHANGLDFYMDVTVVDHAAAERARHALRGALAALDARSFPDEMEEAIVGFENA